MSNTVTNLRSGLWGNLKAFYDKFPTQQGELAISTVEDFIKTALGE